MHCVRLCLPCIFLKEVFFLHALLHSLVDDGAKICLRQFQEFERDVLESDSSLASDLRFTITKHTPISVIRAEQRKFDLQILITFLNGLGTLRLLVEDR